MPAFASAHLSLPVASVARESLVCGSASKCVAVTSPPFSFLIDWLIDLCSRPLVDKDTAVARPRFASSTVHLDEHLEEVHLGELTGPIRQRHEDLASLPLPLRDRRFDQCDADAMPVGDQQLV